MYEEPASALGYPILTFEIFADLSSVSLSIILLILPCVSHLSQHPRKCQYYDESISEGDVEGLSKYAGRLIPSLRRHNE